MTHPITRRSLIKASAQGAAILSAGTATGLSGCSDQPDTPPLNTKPEPLLSPADIEFILAIAPVILSHSYPASLPKAEAEQRLVKAVSDVVGTLGGHARDQLAQLFFIMGYAPLRLVVGAPLSGWKDASREDIEHFLQSWRSSGLGIKNMGYASLCKILCISWYTQPESFAYSGYPGPPSTEPAPGDRT